MMWLKIAKNLQDIKNKHSVTDVIAKKLISKNDLAKLNSVSKNELISLNRVIKTLDQKLSKMKKSFINASSKFVD